MTTAKLFGVNATYNNGVVLSGSGFASSLTRYFGKLLGVTYVWSDWKSQDYINKGYLGNTTVYSVVTWITKSCTIPPFKVYRVVDKAKAKKYKALTGPNATKESLHEARRIKELAYEEDEDHPMNALINKPNKWQSGNEFTETSVGFKLLTGNRYLFVNQLDSGANAGRPYEVYNLPSQHMTPVASEDLWNIVGYELILGSVVKLPKDAVIHSRYWNPYYDGCGSHLIGLSPLKAASKTLERAGLAETRGATMLKNAGADGILFNKETTNDDVSPEQLGQMKQTLNEQILGTKNAGKIHVANGDLGFIKFGLTADELKVVDQERYSDEKICNIFRFPAGLLMANANATDNNIAAWNKQLITQAVLPALVDLRDDWNQIAAMYGEEIYVDFDASFFPELKVDMAKVAATMAQCYWLTLQEKRDAMDYDDDESEPMLKQYLIPNNLTPINNLAYLEDELNRTIEEDSVGNMAGASDRLLENGGE